MNRMKYEFPLGLPSLPRDTQHKETFATFLSFPEQEQAMQRNEPANCLTGTVNKKEKER